MAGLAAFTGYNWKQLIAPKAAQSGSAAEAGTPHAATGQTDSSSRIRTAGIRERTDESCHMVDGAHALSNITSSCRGDLDIKNIGTDSLHVNGFANGSLHDDRTADRDSFDAIEADINALKETVTKLREDDRRSETPTSAISCPADMTLRTRIPAPAKSAAARLQEQHAKQQEQKVQSKFEQRETHVPVPSPVEFPGLGHTDGAQLNTGHANGSRKPSYANMATHGMMEAIGQNFSGTNGQVASDITSDGLASSQTQSSLAISNAATSFTTNGDLGDESVIVLSSTENIEHTYANPVGTLKGPPTTPSKASPRFAQPTLSFARRADETLSRKNSITGSPRTDKFSPDGSPSKHTSMRTLTQRQQKRKSLPGDWLNTGHSQNPDMALNDGLASSDHPSPRRGEAAAAGGDVLVRTVDSDTPSPKEHIVRKKTSTFMSPTKAATSRTMATIGQQDTAKPISPRLQKGLARINTSLLPTMGPLSSDSVGSCLTSPETVILTDVPTLPQAREIIAQTKNVVKRPVPIIAPRRSTVGTPVAEHLAEQARAAGLPMPQNTVAKRRVSQGHLLLPIMSKLDKVGLLKDSPRFAATIQEEPGISPPTQTMRVVRQQLPETPPQQQQPAMQTVSVPLDEQPPQKRCVPPHVRAANRAAAAKVETAKKLEDKENQRAQCGSLRATAQVFEPMCLPQTVPGHESIGVGLPDPSCFYSAEEWAQFPWETRNSILMQRGSIPREARSSSLTMPLAMHRPRSDSGFQPNLSGHRAWSTQQPTVTSTISTDVFKPNDHGVEAGQILKPHIDPQTLAMQWTMRDLNGSEVPISFGRAAAPRAASPRTPCISPASDDTSPHRTPRSVSSRWTIGSAGQPQSVFGWTGGDGREIKFVGHGPDAERDSNGNIKFQFHKNKNVNTGRGPRMIHGDEQDDGSPGQPLAPRSRRQWAEQLNYPKVPCNEINIRTAIEQMPMTYAQKLMGFCHDCSD